MEVGLKDVGGDWLLPLQSFFQHHGLLRSERTTGMAWVDGGEQVATGIAALQGIGAQWTIVAGGHRDGAIEPSVIAEIPRDERLVAMVVGL